MSTYLQAAAGILIAVILALTLKKNSPDLAILLSMAVCIMVAVVGLHYLQPVTDFLKMLEASASLQEGILSVLLKAVGIGLISEVAGLVCSDAGCSAMGKALHIMGTAVILWLSIPVFTGLLELIRQIMGEI